MQQKTKFKILNVSLTVFFSVLAITTVTLATTTISANLVTEGTLAVTGASTLTGLVTAPAGISTAGSTTDITLNDGTIIKAGVTSGTTLYSLVVVPKSSVDTAGGIKYHDSMYVGGTFGATAYHTYGLAVGFTRDSVAAVTSFDGYDTGLDLRVQNNKINHADYDLQGAFIKAKNKGSTGGVVGTVRGLNVEANSEEGATTTDLIGQEISIQNDGTTTVTKALGLKFTKGSGGNGYFTDIKLQNDAIIAGGAGTNDSTIKTQVGTPANGSMYIATDGKVYFMVSGTWTQLNIN